MGTSPFQMGMGTDGVAVFDGQPVILVEKTDFINETRNFPETSQMNLDTLPYVRAIHSSP